MKSIKLYYTEGSSDKIYNAEIVKEGTGYKVNFCYGRRDGNWAYSTKNKSPVPLHFAETIYYKLVKSKTDKGYTENPSGVPYSSAPTNLKTSTSVTKNAPKMSQAATKAAANKIPDGKFAPQLLNPIDDKEVNSFIDDEFYMAQEKMDGKRISILVTLKNNKTTATAYNRKGQKTTIPPVVIDAACCVKANCQLDGELIADKYYAFDLLQFDSKNLRNDSAKDRWLTLQGSFALYEGDHFICVPTAFTEDEKSNLFNTAKQDGSEGVVFKHIASKYTSGRPNTGGNQVKFKFYKTATVVVIKENAKNSVEMGVLEGKKLISVGNVTIPPNKPSPKKGARVEVRYLYAYKSGSLYQPTYLADRSDEIDKKECIIDQLVYKGEGEEEGIDLEVMQQVMDNMADQMEEDIEV